MPSTASLVRRHRWHSVRHRPVKTSASSVAPCGVPYVFWFVGGTDPAVYAKAKQEKTINKIPSNHSPKFAPQIHPTLETGLQAMLTAASAWLCPRV